MTQTIDDFDFVWQVQYLVRLEGHFLWQAHYLVRLAGDFFLVTGAALRDILGDSRDAKCCILQYKIVSKLGRVRSPKRRVRDDDFVVGCVRIMVESSFYWRKHSGSFR